MNTEGLMFPKGRPAKLDKADRLKARVSIDDRESATVKARSGGRCEVGEHFYSGYRWLGARRCLRRANHVHHLLGGIGVRGRGESAKAIRKQHVCSDCHSDIGNHVLVRQGDLVPHFMDTYRRVK